MSVFSPENIRYLEKNWVENNGVFNSLLNVNLSKGYNYPILNYSEYKQRCMENCEVINPKDREGCRSNCEQFVDNFVDNIKFAKEKCPRGDPLCCKREAKDNDFAYFYCINQTNSFPPVRNESPLLKIIYILLCLMIFFVFFGILFLIFP